MFSNDLMCFLKVMSCVLICFLVRITDLSPACCIFLLEIFCKFPWAQNLTWHFLQVLLGSLFSLSAQSPGATCLSDARGLSLGVADHVFFSIKSLAFLSMAVQSCSDLEQVVASHQPGLSESFFVSDLQTVGVGTKTGLAAKCLESSSAKRQQMLSHSWLVQWWSSNTTSKWAAASLVHSLALLSLLHHCV